MGSFYDMEYVQYKMNHFSFRVQNLKSDCTIFRNEEYLLKKRFEKLKAVLEAWSRLRELGGGQPVYTEVHNLLGEKNAILDALNILDQRLDTHYIDSCERNDRSFGTGGAIRTGTPIAKRLQDFSDAGSSVGYGHGGGH